MNLRQPWEDTYSLLTGAQIKRSTRLGEQFETVEQPREAKRVRKFLHHQMMRLFLLPHITFR